MSRIKSTVSDLVKLNKKSYCELGPGLGEISLLLKDANKDVVAVEAPWASEESKTWGESKDVKIYLFEFFTGDFNTIEEPVDCFVLAHAIAHFRYSPYILLKKIYSKLPEGGTFYLSTVNGSSFENVMKLFRGHAVTGKVTSEIKEGYKEAAKDFNKTQMHQIWDDWMHVKEYTKEELEEMFLNVGFKVKKSFYRNNFSHWKRNIVTKFFPRLSEEIIIIGEK